MSWKQNSQFQGLFKATINGNCFSWEKQILVAPKDAHTPSIFSFPSPHPFTLVAWGL